MLTSKLENIGLYFFICVWSVWLSMGGELLSLNDTVFCPCLSTNLYVNKLKSLTSISVDILDLTYVFCVQPSIVSGIVAYSDDCAWLWNASA